jgi:hypothetical protein
MVVVAWLFQDRLYVHHNLFVAYKDHVDDFGVKVLPKEAWFNGYHK